MLLALFLICKTNLPECLQGFCIVGTHRRANSREIAPSIECPLATETKCMHSAPLTLKLRQEVDRNDGSFPLAIKTENTHGFACESLHDKKEMITAPENFRKPRSMFFAGNHMLRCAQGDDPIQIPPAKNHVEIILVRQP